VACGRSLEFFNRILQLRAGAGGINLLSPHHGTALVHQKVHHQKIFRSLLT
jgi:hypothetical protein